MVPIRRRHDEGVLIRLTIDEVDFLIRTMVDFYTDFAHDVPDELYSVSEKLGYDAIQHDDGSVTILKPRSRRVR